MNAHWTSDELERLRENGVLHPVEWLAARSLFQLGAGDAALFAAMAAARADLDGHSCADLARVAGTALSPLAPELLFPALSEWLEALHGDDRIGAPGSGRPLILDAAQRLYLARNFDHEARLAAALRERLTAPDRPPAELLRIDLARLFESRAPADDSAQQIAVAAALGQRLFLLTGGPGTGKTHTVLRLLLIALRHAPAAGLRIALAAPTGKAAQRLAEALRQGRAALSPRLPDADWPCALRGLPESASTLHRLLGASRDGRRFRHGPQLHLPFDLVLVDEASMVDLGMMRRLLDALAPAARLVLVGDADQLASVEAGSVFADLCRAAGSVPRYAPPTAFWLAQATATTVSADGAASDLGERLAVLDRNYRSRPELAGLASAVRSGELDRVIEQLSGSANEVLDWQPAADPAHLYRTLDQWIDPRSGAGLFDALHQAADPGAALAALAGFRLLCAVRGGSCGSLALNAHIERAVRRRYRIAAASVWYRARPLIVTRNDSALGVVNGDVGIVWPDRQGTLQVYLIGVDGAERSLACSALPAHESCYAMTVHKAQGSEFERVVLVLPGPDLPLVNRELVYTAVTRARAALGLWATPAALAQALARRQSRQSGLAAALTGDCPSAARWKN